jgi:hypothetical protein
MQSSRAKRYTLFILTGLRLRKEIPGRYEAAIGLLEIKCRTMEVG